MFYVYAHIDPLSNIIRYVGKGHARRAYSFSHRYGRHKKWISNLKKLGLKPIVQIIENNLTELEALTKEVELIAKLKSENIPLTNGTLGGDGISGFKHTEEFKIWIRSHNLGSKQSKEAISNMVATKIGKPRSEKAKLRISEGRKGMKFTEEHKRKLSEARKRRYATK